MGKLTKKVYNKAKENDRVPLPFLKLGVKETNPDGSEGAVQSTGKHKVKLIKERKVDGEDYHTGEERKEIEYVFEENGDKNRYRRPVFDKSGTLHYFHRQMKEVDEGERIELEMERDGNRNIINVRKLEDDSESVEKEKPDRADLGGDNGEFL